MKNAKNAVRCDMLPSPPENRDVTHSDLRKNTVQGGQEHEITEHFGWAPLHYHHYDIDTSVFTEEDFDEIKNSGYMFFRKVVPGISDRLMDKIDELRGEE